MITSIINFRSRATIQDLRGITIKELKTSIYARHRHDTCSFEYQLQQEIITDGTAAVLTFSTRFYSATWGHDDRSCGGLWQYAFKHSALNQPWQTVSRQHGTISIVKIAKEADIWSKGTIYLGTASCVCHVTLRRFSLSVDSVGPVVTSLFNIDFVPPSTARSIVSN